MSLVWDLLSLKCLWNIYVVMFMDIMIQGFRVKRKVWK